MARTPLPRYRKDRDYWFVRIGARKVKLADGKANRAAAMRAYHDLMAASGRAGGGDQPAPVSVLVLANQFLGHCERELAPGTLAWYARHLKSFCEVCGDLPAADIKPLHVTRWLAGKDWAAGNRRGAITALKRCFNWGRKQRYLDSNPLADVERPPATRREVILTTDQYHAIMAAIPDQEFRDLLSALWESGARPGEVMTLTADRVDLKAATWAVRNKTRRKTGKPWRTINLTPRLIELSRRLLAVHPEGLLFRNTKGTAWTRHTVAHRFERLRKKLGLGSEATAYSLRHLYITDGLQSGVPIATMAELVGHTGTQMIQQVYNHLSDRREHLKEAARQVRPDPPTDPEPSV